MGSVLGRIDVETPRFTVEEKTDAFEIRRYPPQMAAEVTYDGDHFQRVGSRSGFFALAGYIGRVGSRSGFFALAGYIGVLGPADDS
ncbi:unnamed protein product [Closterium sp. NIES-65]|nr:unnamed protein product [Closterium sp. NIES-65]